jgi:hypothetical protein
MEENRKIYEVRVECRAFYTALVKAGNGQEAVKAAEELATDASPIEFDIGRIVGSEIVRSNPEPG